jgi:anti-sigma factor RsiW
MNSLDCGTTRDLLPPFVRHQLTPRETTRVDLHLEHCGECRQEVALVRLLAGSAAPAPAPAELRQRVLLAVRRHVRPRRATPARLAMAATLAAAAIGGSLLFQRVVTTGALDAVATIAFDEQGAALSWAVTLDPLLYGGPAFEYLSVEELEVVLSELDR